MGTKSSKVISKWTPAQIKEHIRKIQDVIEQQKSLAKKDDIFIAITPEEIERKLNRLDSPMFVSSTWTSPAIAPGGTFNYGVGIYNPDPTTFSCLFVHVWIGPGNVDPTVGTFLLNADTRFPRLTLPRWAGLGLSSGQSANLSFALKVPSTIEKTNYLGNSCLMRFNGLDVGTYLDRGGFILTVQ
jgi:hypothetical protein